MLISICYVAIQRLLQLISSGCIVVLHRARQPAVYVAGCTPHPDAAWVTQQARQVAWRLADRAEPVRFLLRDHDAKFTVAFDEVFQAQGARIVRTPVQMPEANGIAERFVRTARSECADWLLIANARHLQRA